MQRHEGGALTAWCGRHADDQVAARILLKLEPVLLGPRTWSITGSSCRDGRAIFVSASKWPQKALGSSPFSTDVSAATSVP